MNSEIFNTHPFTAKLVTNGQDLKEDTTSMNMMVTANIPMQDDAVNVDGDKSNIHYYTRSLIDYDMTLFLSPMEIASAVLGMLIQKYYQIGYIYLLQR